MRLPIRARITAAFAAVMLLLLIGIGVLAYLSMSAALLDEIDSGLRFRASAVAHTSYPGGVEVPNVQLQEPTEAFEQFVTHGGRVLRASRGFEHALLRPGILAEVQGPRFFDRDIPAVTGRARLLVIPLDDSAAPAYLVVGTSTADRADALRQLAKVLLIGGPAAIVVACVAAWLVAGWALNPVDRMQQQAAAITMSGLDRRMPVPRTRDELQRLALTLNDMLDRLGHSMATERSFLERASHELRTPLTALRAEVDLALRRRRSADELSTALRSVSQETDRLARLAEDLLVLARANDGRLPLHRETVSLETTLESAGALFAARALEFGIELVVSAPAEMISIDPLRVRQALVNLLDNAMRHTPRQGTVRVTGTITADQARIAVADTGAGFDDADQRIEDIAPGAGAPGLGLRIVRAVAVSHGGSVHVGRGDGGGAEVVLVLPRAEPGSTR